MPTPGESESCARAARDDLDLVRRVLSGDEQGYRLLMRKYERRVYAICYRITCNEGAAEDAAQDAFVRAYFALRKYDQTRPFLPWLTRIAVNRALTAAARESTYQPLPEGFSETHAATDAAETSDAACASGQLERAARDAVASLPPKLRAVVALRVFEEMSYDEIAHALRISIGTVMSRLSRGRERLRGKLARFVDRGA